jgi:opacity protein-like surface antigen
MRQQNLRVVITLMLSLLCWVPAVWAEPYIAAYAGYSLLSDTDLKADTVSVLQPIPFQVKGIRFSTEVDNSAIFGGKIGYWFDFFPLVGAELDIYGFSPDIFSPPQTSGTIRLTKSNDFDLGVTAVSINLMGRYPVLKSPDFPRGRIQPYIGIGPGLFITSIDDLEPDPRDNIGSKTLTFGGLQIIGGLKFFLLKKLALFAEYKFSHFTADLSGASERFNLGATQNIDASHFYGGVAYHFY